MEKSEPSEVAEPMIPRVGHCLGMVKLGAYPSGHELLNQVVSFGRVIDKSTAEVLAGIKVSPKEKTVALYAVTGQDLGIPEGAEYPLDRIYSLAHGHGLEVCSREVALLTSLHFNALKPALIATSVVSTFNFCITGDKLVCYEVGDCSKILFASYHMAIFAHSRPGHC